MKKSYHSIVVPMVDAITALRRWALWSDADSVSYVALVIVMLQPFPLRRGQTPLPSTEETILPASVPPISIRLFAAAAVANLRFSQLDRPTTPSARRRCCGSHRVRRRAG